MFGCGCVKERLSVDSKQPSICFLCIRVRRLKMLHVTNFAAPFHSWSSDCMPLKCVEIKGMCAQAAERDRIRSTQPHGHSLERAHAIPVSTPSSRQAVYLCVIVSPSSFVIRAACEKSCGCNSSGLRSCIIGRVFPRYRHSTSVGVI